MARIRDYRRYPRLEGKTCLITGASNGIGQASAIALAELGARLVLLCRDPARGEETKAEIIARTGNRDIEILIADLSSQQQIRDAARQFIESGRDLHILLNNAGVVNLEEKKTAEGVEETFAVNHLAYFLLTHLLLDRLRASAPARIVNVASEAHRLGGGKLDFDFIEGRKPFKGLFAYGQSKLANILFTRALAERLKGSGVTVNAAHPGGVATGLAQNNRGFWIWFFSLLRPFIRTPEKGAETSVYLCASEEAAGISGAYFADCKEKAPTAGAQDREDGERLWKMSADLTGAAS